MCDKPSQEELHCGSEFFKTADLSELCVPTQTQIRQQLGSKLSDVFFEFLGREARVYLGLEPPLDGPDTVWVTPGSRIDNKVALTPVPEPEVLHWKALTHGSILEVGQKYIEKLENQHRMAMELALKKQADVLEEECEKRGVHSLDFNTDTGNAGFSCKKVVATLMEHFDNCFKDLVKKTQLRMRKECELRVEEERAEVAAVMFNRMKEQLRRQDRELCSEFHDILCNELNLLASRYIKQIEEEREIAIHLMKETVHSYEKMLRDLKTKMELNNVVDICQAIARERVEFKEKIKKKFSIVNDSNPQEEINQLKEENEILQKMATERLKRLLQWRKKIQVLLEEFQRFINFALHGVPGQSEFLLNFEKLLLERFPEDSFQLPKDYMRCKDRLEGKLSSTTVQEEPLPKTPEVRPEALDIIKTEETNAAIPRSQSIIYKADEDDAVFAFDYDQFKRLITKRPTVDAVKSKKKKSPKKKAVCVWKKKSKPVTLNKESEMYHAMTLAGENEREHLAPASCFLQKRLETVLKLCSDDPEFTKIMLGSFGK